MGVIKKVVDAVKNHGKSKGALPYAKERKQAAANVDRDAFSRGIIGTGISRAKMKEKETSRIVQKKRADAGMGKTAGPIEPVANRQKRVDANYKKELERLSKTVPKKYRGR